MTTHFKCGSNCECIHIHRYLLLLCPFFCCFLFFCYCIFLFVVLLEQGYFNVTLLPMQPVGWGYPPPAAPPRTAAAATAAGAAPPPPPHAAVQPGLQQPSTTPWSMQPQVSCRAHYCFHLFPLRVLRACCVCYPSRGAHYASPRGASFVLFSANAVPVADPVLPNPAFPARAAVPVTSCLTAVVSHAVPRWVADLGLPTARQSSSTGFAFKSDFENRI